jgi:hypothetical protein
MARHVLPDQYYTFTASTRTIVLSRAVKRESLLLITNVTTNTVIYNFSDPNLKATGFTIGTGIVASAGAASDASTTIVLNYNTTSMSNSDKLQIIVDEYESKFSPADALMDPVGKLRTSTPQALIDTDFEYGLQPTKWEQLSMVNMRPSAYFKPNWPNYGRSTGASQVTQSVISSIVVSNASRIVTVTVDTTATTRGWNIGQAVFIQDTMWGPANGLFVIENVSASTFTYKAREVWTTGATPTTDLNDTAIPSQIFDAPFYTQAGFGGTITPTYSGPVQTIVCGNPHGLEVGNEIMVLNDQSGGAASSTYGNHQVASVTSPYAFTYYTDATGGTAGTFGSNTIYVRPPGTSLHRAFDGGINFSTNSGWHNQHMIRQTRRYFRYQSGKGIQISTGTSLRPQLYVDQVYQVSGAVCAVLTKYQHGLQPGVTITVGGSTDTAYNIATATVLNVLDSYRFTYTASGTPATNIAPGSPYVTAKTWYGGTNRTGLFDQQNGMFWEYDGQNMNVVARKSTYQIGGFSSVTNNSSRVTGYTQTNALNLTSNGSAGQNLTQYNKQLLPNDFIVIRGATYRVLNIIDDQTMDIVPTYRGPTASKVVISKVTEQRVAQSAFNIDRLDGTGPSGFVLDPGKMQMFYIDYSWYGAGWCRFGVRAADGNVIYCHKFVNNNQNQEAWMRSGNLPARYETNTYAASTIVSSGPINTGDTTINVASTTGFPSTGTLMIRTMTSTSAGQTEYVNYTGTTATSFTGCIRGLAGNTGVTVTATQGSNVVTTASTSNIQIGQMAYTTTLGDIPQGTYVVSFVANTSITLSRAWLSASGSKTLITAPMGQTAQTFAYSATRPISVSLHAPLVASTIQHWGTSVIMDGRYDDDKSFVFTRGSVSSFSIAANTNNAVMSIRVAPSVANGNVSSTFGARDLVNRMQLVLRAADVFTNQPMLITLVLNAELSAANTWVSQGGSSLAQYFIYSSATTYTNGEVIGGFYLSPGASSGLIATSLDLSLVRDLGNSINGGGLTTYTQYLNTNGNTGMYPDGPDTVTIFAQNLNASTAALTYMRLSWTEAQA